MPIALPQMYRGTTAQHANFIGAEGSITVDIDKDVVVVHDGVTKGGNPMVSEKTLATADTVGLVKPDNQSIFVDETGTLRVMVQSSTVSIPVITGPLEAPIGLSSTYSFTATSGLVNGSITKFEVTFDGKTQDVVATEGAGSVSLLIPADTDDGATFTLKVIAHDTYGGSSQPAEITITAKKITVATPSLTAPVSDAYVSPASVSFVTSAFKVNGSNDTHVASYYKITTDPAGANAVYSSGRQTGGLTSFTASLSSALTPGQVYYAFARHEGGTFGLSDWSTGVAIRASGAKTPTVTAPTAGAYVSPKSVSITTSTFSTDGGITDTHAASYFKICSDSAGNSPIWESGRSTSSLTSITANPTLTPGQTYYAFARHEGAATGLSAWSSGVRIVASSVKTPTITSPAAGAEVSSSAITIVTSAFAVTGSSDTHASTDWKITSDAAGNDVVAQALGSSDKTSHVFDSPNVVKGQSYYLWARHNGTNNGSSDWVSIQVTIMVTRHGEIIYDTDGNPAAVIVGSFASNGAEPFTINGQKKWLAVGLASKRGVSLGWVAGTTNSAAGYNVDITTIANVSLTSSKLGSSNTAAAGTGNYVSSQCTDADMDAAFNETETSKSLTTKILAYNANMQAAKHCRSITLASLGAMDLPSIDALMRIYQMRDIIDALDPTAAANSAKKLSQATWGFGSTYSCVWSASELSATYAWCVRYNGFVNNYAKYSAYGVCPVLEIDA